MERTEFEFGLSLNSYLISFNLADTHFKFAELSPMKRCNNHSFLNPIDVEGGPRVELVILLYTILQYIKMKIANLESYC